MSHENKKRQRLFARPVPKASTLPTPTRPPSSRNYSQQETGEWSELRSASKRAECDGSRYSTQNDHGLGTTLEDRPLSRTRYLGRTKSGLNFEKTRNISSAVRAALSLPSNSADTLASSPSTLRTVESSATNGSEQQHRHSAARISGPVHMLPRRERLCEHRRPVGLVFQPNNLISNASTHCSGATNCITTRFDGHTSSEA